MPTLITYIISAICICACVSMKNLGLLSQRQTMPGAERAEVHPELGLQSFAEGVTMVTMVLGDIAPLQSK